MGYDKKIGKTFIEISKKYFRPTEVDLLLGDATKAKEKLGWQPLITIDKLIQEMVLVDCDSH